MPSDEGTPNANGPRRGFPVGTLLKALLPALAATAFVVYLHGRATAVPDEVRPDGMKRVALFQKDSSFALIPPSAGGATGEALYAPRGATLHLVVHASGLASGIRYVLELEVDDAVYAVASYTPDAHGALTVDTTLASFAEGACVGSNFNASRPIAGKHQIKFRLKRDGSPASGLMPGVAPDAPGAQLACHGNGDGKFSYALLEDRVADFTGTDAAAHDSAK